MPPKPQKSKAAKALAASSSSRSKGKKKKWSKGKLREKRNHRVVFNQALYDQLLKEVPKKLKVVTIYNLIEAYKINGSLARRSIKELLGKNIIQPVFLNAKCPIYSVVGGGKTQDDEKGGKGGKQKGGKGGDKGKGGKQQKQQKQQKQGKGKKRKRSP